MNSATIASLRASKMPSSPHRSLRRWALTLGLAALCASGCKKDPIEVLDPKESEGGDFGRGDLLTAVETFRKTPTSATAYRAFAKQVESMRPRLDKQTHALADRMLAFLAIGPLEANESRPAEERLEKLASTVWPSALGPPPTSDEGGRDYLQRVCADDLAGECLFMVPEYWSILLAAKVWRRFRHKAQETFSICRSCQRDPTYERTLSRYDELSFPVETLAAERKGDGHPREWPRAKPSAQPWETDIVSLEVARSGALRLSGSEVSGAHWRDRLSALSKKKVVGLYMRPDLSVARLREYVRDLGSLGFREARLQVRMPSYPYELRYYPLATKRRAGKIRVNTRATDTITVLVLAADQATKRAGGLKGRTLNVLSN